MGRLAFAAEQGTERISVFVSPDPLRAGPVDISILLQSIETGHPIDSSQILVRITPQSPGTEPVYALATQAAATNKLLRAALVDLPTPGLWDVAIAYTTSQNLTREVSFTVEASPRLPPWLTAWPQFCWPAVVVLLYGIHRWLVARRNRYHRLSKHSTRARVGKTATDLELGHRAS
jgi:hypothetical protein